VYDVSAGYDWRGGLHWVQHYGSADLTGELAQASHGGDLLARFPVVGEWWASEGNIARIGCFFSYFPRTMPLN
jgi:predicted heme/steroid binding protein